MKSLARKKPTPHYRGAGSVPYARKSLAHIVPKKMAVHARREFRRHVAACHCDPLALAELVDVQFQLALVIRRLVFVNDALGGQAIQI